MYKSTCLRIRERKHTLRYRSEVEIPRANRLLQRPFTAEQTQWSEHTYDLGDDDKWLRSEACRG